MNRAHALAVPSTGTQQCPCRVTDAAGQGSGHARCGLQDFLPLQWESAPLSLGRQRQGRFCKGGQLAACKSQRYKKIRGRGWMRSPLSTERLEGRSLHCGSFELATVQILQTLALPEEHEIAPDQALKSFAILAK